MVPGLLVVPCLVVAILLAAHFLGAALAQDAPKPRTRAEAIEQQRREKRARLWPERQSPIAAMVNGYVERGLLDGVKAGLGGGNGPQVAMGGMRTGQGLALGAGYRRSDLWNDSFGFRTTVRGTPQLAWMADTQFYFPALYTKRGFFDVYTKYEYSPQMDYYGEGPNSSLEDRTSYSYSDMRLELRGGWEFFDFLSIGGTAGGVLAWTGSGKRVGVPSIEDTFAPEDVPGLFVPGKFLQTGAFVQVDWRDNPGGPSSGGNYKLEWTQHWDLTAENRFNFRRLDATVDQYFPYFNETRVVALHLHGNYTLTDAGQDVPFYLQPTLGGNDDLRGFAPYRFHADNAFHVNLEHRWHSFSALDFALFFDAGKVSEFGRRLYEQDFRYNGGIGLRFKMRETVIMRIDQAYGNEGYRFIWSFNNIF